MSNNSYENIPDLHELEFRANRAAADCTAWASTKAPNRHLATCASRLGRQLLKCADILAEMANDPEAPRH